VNFPKKRFGQHFLQDENVLDQIVATVNPKPDDHLVEIGPGEGVLTKRLLPEVNGMVAIELDRDLIPRLRQNCLGLGELRIYQKDVLKFDFTELSPPLRLVGNLPYNISTPILFHVINNISIIKDMHFMLQQEVAERIVTDPGSKTYGRLSVMVQYYCEVELLFHVGARAFFPPPKVESAFIRLVPRTTIKLQAKDEKNFSRVVQAAFSMRRKTIRNSLRKMISEEQLRAIGIDPQVRPEDLAVEEFVSIANQLS
jgi:16S rRNA (adenine1518-N6/adenine1519-N6)-dimethyltransferase